ncbi:MAG TPA: hypothetical protein VHK91_08600 [Flavisolibacter sp.]|nr:hypothetical protein [Flavisolibacter sp.]
MDPVLANKMIVLVVIAMAAFLGMLIIIIRNALSSFDASGQKALMICKDEELIKQNELVMALIGSGEKRQEYFASILHQDIGNLLSLSTMQVGTFLEDIKDDMDPEDVDLMNETVDLMKLTQTKLQNYCYHLSPILLPLGGLDMTLDMLLRLECQNTKIQRIVFLNQPKVRIGLGQELILYRMTQEVVNNIVNHARPEHIHLSQRYEKEIYSITIFHDGQGINQKQFEAYSRQPLSQGLKRIKSLMQVSGATIAFLLDEEGAYTITISIQARQIDMKKMSEQLGQ